MQYSPVTHRLYQSLKLLLMFNVRTDSVVYISSIQCNLLSYRTILIDRSIIFSRPMMKLLEVIRTSSTSDETFQTLLNFGKQLGKITVSCKV